MKRSAALCRREPIDFHQDPQDLACAASAWADLPRTPAVDRVDVVQRSRVRRSRLYYLQPAQEQGAHPACGTRIGPGRTAVRGGHRWPETATSGE
mgnify:CR=1 FL=1